MRALSRIAASGIGIKLARARAYTATAQPRARKIYPATIIHSTVCIHIYTLAHKETNAVAPLARIIKTINSASISLRLYISLLASRALISLIYGKPVRRGGARTASRGAQKERGIRGETSGFRGGEIKSSMYTSACGPELARL